VIYPKYTEPKKYELNPMGHVWERNEDGSVNALAFDYDDHTGPRCVVCGYVFCDNCQEMPDEECPGGKP